MSETQNLLPRASAELEGDDKKCNKKLIIGVGAGVIVLGAIIALVLWLTLRTSYNITKAEYEERRNVILDAFPDQAVEDLKKKIESAGLSKDLKNDVTALISAYKNNGCSKTSDLTGAGEKEKAVKKELMTAIKELTYEDFIERYNQKFHDPSKKSSDIATRVWKFVKQLQYGDCIISKYTFEEFKDALKGLLDDNGNLCSLQWNTLVQEYRKIAKDFNNSEEKDKDGLVIKAKAILTTDVGNVAAEACKLAKETAKNLEKLAKETAKGLEKMASTGIDEKLNAVDQKEGVVDEKENDVAQKEGVIAEKENVVDQKEGVIVEKENVVDQKEGSVDEEGNVVGQKEDVAGDKGNAVDQKEGGVDEEGNVVGQKE